MLEAAMQDLAPECRLDALMQHGGRVSAARATFPAAPEPWIDLSTGINPHAYPVGDLPVASWRRLPDPADEATLTRAARRYYGVPDGVDLLAAPGTQAIIQALPRLVTAARVAVLHVGYDEHPAGWRAAGAAVTIANELSDLADADVSVVVNPNNPDGRFVDPADLASLADGFTGRNGLLVVDEAFGDVLPRSASLVPYLGRRRALVLRSFGKFFGLAGLRLGFVMGDPVLCGALRSAFGPWAVSGPALALGARALDDEAWQDASRHALVSAAKRLDSLLAAAGCALVGGTALFRLVRHARAAALFERLGEAGILVRPFAHDRTLLRLGLPPDEAAWRRLAVALAG